MKNSVATVLFILLDEMQRLAACVLSYNYIRPSPSHPHPFLKKKMFRENSQQINIFMAVFVLSTYSVISQ
jgi:hypothetical protein